MCVSFLLSRFTSEQSLSLCLIWTHQDADQLVKSLTSYCSCVGSLITQVWQTGCSGWRVGAARRAETDRDSTGSSECE